MSEEWVIRIVAKPDGIGLFEDPFLYYSETGWQSDITHAAIYHTKDEAEKIAFSVVTADPTKVGCVSVAEVPT